MNSPLEKHKVRLRGLFLLHGTEFVQFPQGDFVWFQRRIHSLRQVVALAADAVAE